MVLLALLCISVFGALDEWHQQFIPQRSMDLLDWAADITGATAGIVLALTLGRRRASA
jgi:VanZ family protein